MVAAHVPPDDLPAGQSPDPSPQLFEGDPERVAGRPQRSAAWLVLPVALVVAGGAALYFWWRGAAPPAALHTADSSASRTTPKPEAAPAIRYPIEGAPQAERAPLPSLQESDATVADGIAGVVGSDAFMKMVQREDIVRRIVATVDNLPRKSVASRVLPTKPIPGQFATARNGDSLVIAPSNSARYTPYVRMAEAVDMKTLAALYMRLYPLFQQAYRDLGYPNGYFNDRLVETIDDLLAAPVPSGPIELTQPKVLYEYADPRLEQRSAGQKVMMRMGSDNGARVKAKLAQFRREIVGPNAKP